VPTRPPRDALIEADPSLLRAIARAGHVESAVGFVVGVALLACGVLALVSAAAGLIDGREPETLALLAAIWAVTGGLLVRSCHAPARLRSSTAFAGVLASWLTLIAVSTVTYEVLGTFEHLDDSLFESVAGFTTTASSVLGDPENVARGVLAWRAGTQWLGGLAALMFVVAVLPSIGVGGLDVTSAGYRYSGTSLRSHRTLASMRRLLTLYVIFTVAGVGLYLVAGMGPFDAVTYAATTISTGGFANHAGSFSHFGSTAVEWAGFGGMVLGGANMALLYRTLRGRDLRGAVRSFELRAYLAAIVVGGTIVTLATAPTGGITHESLRHAYFHVASATSTTGHWVGLSWGAWSVAPQVLLLAIMGVGSMSGSAGGGFRQVRALALAGYLRRELILQLHPRAVAAVRVGRRPVSEELVGRMIGYQAQYIVVAGIGAVVVAVLGGDLVTSITGSISALANVGPALGELVPGDGGIRILSRPERAALLPLMLLGRLEIAPVLVGVGLAATGVRRVAQRGVGRGDTVD
jgi:trk system potassium uptake protein TrkH